MEERSKQEEILIDEDGLYTTGQDRPEERAILVGVNFTSTRPGASRTTRISTSSSGWRIPPERWWWAAWSNAASPRTRAR